MDVRHIRIRVSSWVAPVTMVCFVIGALLALQFTTQRRTGASSRYGRAEQLTQMLALSQSNIEARDTQIQELRAKLDEYRRATTTSQENLAPLNKQLVQDQIALGTVAVKGPGIIMTLDDSILAKGNDENKEPFLVHDYDLWPVVNELRSAGAEAIAIKDQRVVGTTAIRCVGSVIRINDVPVGSPFVIKAIGDAPVLAGALTVPGGVVAQFQASQFPVKIETRKDIVIDAVPIVPKIRWATPVPTETKP